MAPCHADATIRVNVSPGRPARAATQTSRDEITHRARHRKHTDDADAKTARRGETGRAGGRGPGAGARRTREDAPNEARRRVYRNPLRII